MVATRFTLAACLTLACNATFARVLPEDRADILYHSYSGGGVTIDGPSVLVRKSYRDKVSVWGNYYVDLISGASIDVEATASKYAEERTEFSVGADYLVDKTLLGIGFTQSSEPDYDASSVRVSASQDFFGDLTTVSMGYSYGSDTVRRNGDSGFEDTATHHSYRLEISQILTPSLLVNLGLEAVTDQGFLNNPYRSVRYADDNQPKGYSYQAEQYPRTRNSDAAAIRAMYYLPWRAAVRGEYRHYADSWGISAGNVEFSYTHPLGEHWELDARLRHYAQSEANFYADIFAHRNASNFLARDKELASFTSQSLGVGVGYVFSKEGYLGFRRGTVNLQADFVRYDYDNFSDVTAGPLGNEPLYGFDALVLRAFVSLWF